ncbi:MAG: DUF1800 family protein, partial [Angustibacter sp.]
MSLTAAASAPSSSTTQAPANLDGSAYTHNDFAWLLARRVTMGATPELMAQIQSQGALNWLNDQLAPTRIDDSAYEEMSARFVYRDLPIWKIRQIIGRDRGRNVNGIIEIELEHMARLMWSKRQLQAQLTDFWGNHFNVTVDPLGSLRARHHFQGVFRRLALGKFSDLLSTV